MSEFIQDVSQVERRVLVIGLGGTGQRVISRVMDIEEATSVVYRIYDTEVWTGDASRLSPILIKANMTRAEMIRKHPTAFPKIARYLRLEEIPPITNTEGTGQFLSQGTLLFIATLPEFIANIRRSVSPLLSGTLSMDVQRQGKTLADNRLYCIVIRSCAGGTGSGPHALITWLLRQELLRLLGNAARLMLVDIVVLPEPFENHVEDNTKIYANTGAFFHMISEYYRNDRSPLVLEFGDDPDLRIKIGEGQASDLTLLVSNQNTSSHSDRGSTMLSLDEIYDICAQFISMNCSSPMASDFYAQFGNIQQESYTMLRNQPTIFSSFGYTESIFRGGVCYDWLVHNEAITILNEITGG